MIPHDWPFVPTEEQLEGLNKLRDRHDLPRLASVTRAREWLNACFEIDDCAEGIETRNSRCVEQEGSIMAWNPSPKVADCREIAHKWDHDQVIIIALTPYSGKIEMASYGENKALCAMAKRLGDAAYDAVCARFAAE